MTDTTITSINGKTVSSTEETVVNGDVVTTVTKTKTVRIQSFFCFLNMKFRFC